MRSKYYVAMFLVLVGANLVTFAITRYWTTKHVLTRAQERLDVTLKKDGLYEQVYPYCKPNHVTMAIYSAGGLYYWWNDAVPYWGAGVMFGLSGIAVLRYQPRNKEG